MYIGKVDSQAKGFTLIEVLVAMVIFSLVMTVAVSSYRLSIINLTKQDRSLNLNTFTTIKLINKQIKSLKPFFYTLENGEKAPFFVGTENTMLFITESPILQDSPLAIAMLYIDRKRIYYCEVTFGSQALTSLKSTIPCEEKIEYLNVENAKFSYFGWKDNLELDNYYSEYTNVNVKPRPAWSVSYLSEKRKVIPLFVRIYLPEQSPLIFELPELNSYHQRQNSVFQG